MKKLLVIAVVSFLLSGCLTLSNNKREEPRRTYELVNTEGKIMKDFFIVNSDYQKSDFEPSRYSMILAAVSFMSELQIINDLDNESKISFLEMFVTNFPDTDSIKEIIIPNLRKDQDAYFFIAPYTSKDGTFMYQIKTNIPISSITDENLRSYYKLELDRNYFIREIPARWVGVMFLEINKDKIFYQGVSYPNLCSPLVVHGDGIGPDKYLKKLLDQNTDIDKITDELVDVTNQLFEARANETDEKKLSQ